MIGFLTGKIRYLDDQIAIVETGGIGYEVLHGGAGERIGRVDDAVSLWIYTYVREDQITLFCFQDLVGKKLFLLLTTVTGVGPKLAMAIITHLEPQELLDAITFGNVKTLCSVSGVGKKVANRLILELKNKLGEVLDLYQVSPTQSPSETTTWRDLGEALSGLGFPESKIRNVIKLARQEHTGASPDINVLLKFALKKIKDC